MNVVLSAILPIVLLMVLGHLLRRRAFLPNAFWTAADKLTYFILFPALLIVKVSQVDLAAINFSQVLGFVVLYFPLVSLMAYGIYRISTKDPKQFSSIYQGVLRCNTYIYFALVEAVWGINTLTVAALIAGIVIPVINVCCVSAFSFAGGELSLKKTTRLITKNPLIIGALLGFLANLFPWLLPPVVLQTFSVLATAALPMALLSIGAAVSLSMLFISQKGVSRLSIWLTTFSRLLLVPALALAVNQWLGIEGEVAIVFVIFAAVPTATSSYILSQQLGGDARMMATLISLETVLSMVSLVFWLNYLI